MIEKDAWMSSFYGKDWIKILSLPDSLSKPAMYEWRIRCENNDNIILANENNFDLVETIVEFSTLVKPDGLNYPGIRFANDSDLEAILQLTELSYTRNEHFLNRFKNRVYFSDKQCEDYYKKSVVNIIDHPDSFTVLSEEDGQVTGYYILKKVEDKIYKGMMSGIHPDHRGKSMHIIMQQYIFNAIGEEITTVNTTQLSNYSIINNHIKQGRRFVKGEYIFYKDVKS